MRLTTKGRYAVTAMLDIAMYGGTCAVTASDVSKRQGISRSYLERLLGQLHQRKLVESTHGPGGGYQLARGMEHISIADIIHAVDEAVDATQCHGKRDCHDGEQCMTHELWENLNLQINRYLASITLAELVDGHRRKQTDKVTAGVSPWVPLTDKRVSANASNVDAK